MTGFVGEGSAAKKPVQCRPNFGNGTNFVDDFAASRKDAESLSPVFYTV